ncbi:meiotic recombination protein SPO11 [Bicyclus anynana]|uniref:DNA topoisomerase (ATP-hydrolyzing) n=1 Tax=Bicyclus anynana TaxID=110368 RepID=A0A6J1MXJ8_BICAN|nr:meiotic recombination protein SPO11 [Bicyclus anynana]
MELMNKDALMLRIDLTSPMMSSFKQDPKLVAAINRLYSREEVVGSALILPERKLNFTEVQDLVKQACDVKGKPDDILTNQAKLPRIGVIKKIEEILANINNSAAEDGPPKLILRNQRLWSNCIYDLDRVTLKAFHNAKTTTLCYSSAEDKSRFNTIIFILTKIHELLSKNLTVTRRELFYQNVTRFGNQSKLDVGVRDVCCLLDSPPWDLGIVATAKGLIAGPLNIYQSDGTIVDCMTSGGTLIPQDINGIKEFKSTAKYILLVEKDAIFQKLLDEGALIRLGPVIILTGKGYPDVCTRQMLCRLVKELRLKALALVDADPHGYEIFLTYKYGSLAQSHLSESLACSSLLMLGARHHDILTLAPKEAQLSLTLLDKRKLSSLIKRPYLNSPVGVRIKSDLEAMQTNGVKAEIEAVAATALCDSYIPAKLIQGDHLG